MATDPATRGTPELAGELDHLLGRQLARIRSRFLIHGVGWLLGASCVGLLVYFALDHSLRLPALVRLVLTSATVVLFTWGLRRHVLYPLGRAFSRDDAAIALERVFPQLRQKLISAHQLKQLLGDPGDVRALRNQSPAMIEKVLADAAEESRSLPVHRVLDSRVTARLWGLSATVSVLLLVGAALQPAVTGAFLQRILGLSVAYPRATTLVMELPSGDGPEVRRVDRGIEVELTLAAGSDLHVNVRAEGAVPREVFLEVDSRTGDRRVAMTSRPGARFRHVFRRIQGDFSFHASGGDDEMGDKIVTVRTINPPLVAEIRATLTPPAYTRQEPQEQIGGNIEALVGTAVDLEVTATAGVRTATLEFIESGLQVQLQPATVQDDSGRSLVYRGAFTISDSDRYRIQLVGDTGLGNPHPGTYPISALEDFAPWGRMLNPDDASMDYLLPTGVLAVRVEARDDYGLTSATLQIEAGESKSELSLWQDPGGPPVVRNMFTRLLEVKEILAGTRAGQEGLLLTGELRDNREPEPLATSLPRRQVQIVDEGQLASAISRHFRATREEVEKALDLQRDRKDRLEEVREKAGQGTTPASLAHSLTGVEVGQGRIQTIAERVHRQLKRAFHLHSFNRLDPAQPAEQVLLLYGEWHQKNPEALSFVPGFYREVLAQRRSGRLGAMETTLDPILAMLETADRLATQSTPQAVRQITRAQVAADGASLAVVLDETLPLQEKILADWQSLLERLDEWNDFQDVIQETRALRDRQRDVQNRTESMRGKR